MNKLLPTAALLALTSLGAPALAGTTVRPTRPQSATPAQPPVTAEALLRLAGATNPPPAMAITLGCVRSGTRMVC